MSPVGVSASRFASALEIGTAKLWVLVIGVNEYHDLTFPSLKYAAIDCQGIGAALAAATDPFPHKEFLIHHDLIAQKPTLARVKSSLHRVVTEAKVQDTILIYFSGHGVVEPIHQGRGYANEQQTILCLSDTDRQQLLTTGLPIQDVLELLRNCAAHSQLLWLDACHSGNLSSIKVEPKDQHGNVSLNPTTQLLASLRHRAVKSHGFYALLSCDEGQQSWEFPDLGHGVFSYYLMLGLGGEAADPQGIIDADGLYRYVYRQTIQYIDRTNQQVRLANQAKRERGEMSCAPEYPIQTPKRIVSGVGEIVLGIQPQAAPAPAARQALIIDAQTNQLSDELDNLSRVLEQDWKFALARCAPAGSCLLAVENQINTFLGETAIETDRSTKPPSIGLLYLRGQITNFLSISGGEDAWFELGNGVRISQTWLNQKLAQSSHSQLILIIDAAGSSATAEWVEAVKMVKTDLIIIACAAPADDPDLFTQVLIEALISAPAQIDLSFASLFTRLQTTLAALGVPCHVSKSDPQAISKIVPEVAIENVKLPPEILAPSPALDFSSSSDNTFGQVNTYLQVERDKIAGSSIDFTANLEFILSQLVGPIAPTLIKHVHSEDPVAIIDKLQLMLPIKFRAIFRQQTEQLLIPKSSSKISPQVLEKAIVEPSYQTASGRGIAIEQSIEIDESLLCTYEHELNLAIGPVSKFIMASTRSSHPQMSAPDLIVALASNIINSTQADLFRRRCQDRS